MTNDDDGYGGDVSCDVNCDYYYYYYYCCYDVNVDQVVNQWMMSCCSKMTTIESDLFENDYCAADWTSMLNYLNGY